MNLTQPLAQPIQFGKYTLYERIGRGGMADVFKGRISGPAGFERVFVVKRILPNLSDDPVFIRMFVEEAKLSARLNHPNIVQIFELGAVEGEYFISMEYIPGRDLAETMRALWRTHGPPRPDLVAYIGREICRALSYAHSLTDEQGHPLGMIHRDVSPSNVMLSYEGAVKLLDFGIAKAMGEAPETTKSGALKGKYAYMAPEQTDGDDVDHRIDIFAAGIVLHEVLSGRRLFKGQNDIQTIERVRRCEVRPPSQMNPMCPPELDAIVLKALSRDRDKRYEHAADMADALDDIVHAARFTPQHLASTVRDLFGGEAALTATGERRVTRSVVTPISTSSSPARAHTAGSSPVSSSSSSFLAGSAAGTGSSTGSSIASSNASSTASSTVPPISLPPRSTGTSSVVTGAVNMDSGAFANIRPQPMWRHAGFWVGAAIVVALGAFAIARGTGGKPSSSADVGAPSRTSGATAKKVKRVPVLVQSEPEGAEIFVSGRLEAVGVTPMWLNVELDKDNPARVMLRKSGFQDKAIAVEQERPPVVTLIPLGSGEEARKKKRDRKSSGSSAHTGKSASESDEPTPP